jgi:hypothetical protein
MSPEVLENRMGMPCQFRISGVCQDYTELLRNESNNSDLEVLYEQDEEVCQYFVEGESKCCTYNELILKHGRNE